MQLVELLFRRKPSPDYAALKARAEEVLGAELGSPGPGGSDKAFLLFHTGHEVEYAEGRVPAQTAVFAADRRSDPADYTQEVQQSWRCDGADALVRGGRHALLVTEMMARPVPPGERVELFHGVLRAAVEVFAPDALVFKHAQQVIAPADYLAAGDEEPIFRPGSLNVRFFNIADSAGDMLMDTRGLTEIGLHDVQCHYRDLDPNEVSRVLFNTAVYVFKSGPVIESGQTVTGTGPNAMWQCQFETALVGPEREVLDLNPGPPHAAGGR